jgi:hypothetical protein
MSLRPVRHISIAIARPADEVYAFLAAPENFPKWASGLGRSFQPLEGGEWLAETPMGRLRLRFSPRNPWGVVDHWVLPAEGEAIYNPMRVVANGDGAEVVFSLFVRAGMSDDEVTRDADWIGRDLAALKRLLEA